jgi:hypothetical protein
MRLISTVRDSAQVEPAGAFLNNLAELGRFPDAEVQVFSGDFQESLAEISLADVNLVGLPREPDFDFLRQVVDQGRATCIFVRDSGEENALA